MNLSRLSPMLMTGQFLVLAALGCGGDSASSGTKLATKQIALVASGDTAGWLTPCGCSSNQSGGLLRRATYLGNIEETAEIVLVDVGGAAAGNSTYDRLKFEAILSGELAMGLAVHNLGASEAALGPEYLREVAKRLHVPFISANLRDAAGKRVTEPYHMIRVCGRKLAIVGVLAMQFQSAGCRISEPRQAVLDLLAEIREKYDSLIVLAYLPEAELRAFAAELPEADLVIGGPTGQCLAPVKVGPLQLASATNKGKFLVSFTAEPNAASLKWTGGVLEMTEKYSDEAEQTKNVTAFRERLAAKDLSAEQSGLGPLSTITFPKQFQIAGSARCQECHAAEFKQWESSSHHHAFETLTSKGAQMDSYCQRCHVNGFGWDGGFVSAKKAVGHTHVGCEDCHGPSLPHVSNAKIKTPLAAKEQCALCHDHENSPEFEYGKYWPKIAHGPAKESPK
jgi:hypothetical protein